MFHRSQRLLLRPVWPEDWKGILAGIADERVVKNLASAPWPYHEDDARAFTAKPMAPRAPRFVIAQAFDAATVGCIGIEPLPDSAEGGETAMELGYWIGPQFWRRGYASEAGRAVLQIARSLGHRRILASHFHDNPASGRVLEKLGFAPTGRILKRHSCARGEAAMSIEYAIELEGADAMMRKAA